ncbi:MAG TPA: hypothetical protein VFV19_16225 [Candidatus Polarisedimenticolaceae bacterium]|nr:hypothetical protein [Candidatus Polarisedimenticolaceae bacterium]
MAPLPKRDLESEAAKHFQGTPGERVQLALKLGRAAMALFLANHPGVSEATARKILSRQKNAGRRPSRVMDGD